MALPIGILLFILGVVAVCAWWSVLLPFVQGLVALSLLFWGLIAMIIGYSERKARRECQAAMNDGEPTQGKAKQAKPEEPAACFMSLETIPFADRIRGGFWGLLVGDALGVPYEFHAPEKIPPSNQIEFEPPAGFSRAHNVPAGTWSGRWRAGSGSIGFTAYLRRIESG